MAPRTLSTPPFWSALFSLPGHFLHEAFPDSLLVTDPLALSGVLGYRDELVWLPKSMNVPISTWGT